MEALSILCWEGYEETSFLDGFCQRHDCKSFAQNLVSDHRAALSVAEHNSQFDVVNLNNPYGRRVLFPAGHIRALDRARYEPGLSSRFLWLESLLRWSYSDNDQLIGIGQRFGPFNFVVNSRKISPQTARDQGFNIVESVGKSKPYGILLFPEFNIFHICIAAGIDPFSAKAQDDLVRFESTAQYWFSNAKLISDDSVVLNSALIQGEIDFFLSGGLFTSAAFRLAGHSHIYCVTPERGPMEGKGGIAFMEITSLTSQSASPKLGESFLQYILEPKIAAQIACNPKVCNPIAQMADPLVFNRLSTEFLHAIQWENLEEDLSRCVPYDIPPDHAQLNQMLDSVCSQTK